MNVRRKYFAIPAGAMLLAVMGAAPAVAANVLEVSPHATLIAKGVAVDVPVTYSCSPPTAEYGYRYLSMHLAQVVRAQQVATSSIEFTPTCDGTDQRITVRLTVDGGNPAFKAGTALVDATLYTFDDGAPEPVVAQVSQEVRVTR